MTRLRVLLAEDHAIVREGLWALLDAQPDMEVIGEAADGRESLAASRSLGRTWWSWTARCPSLNGPPPRRSGGIAPGRGCSR